MRPDDDKAWVAGLARSLRPGDEVTTTMGNRVVVGAVHADEQRQAVWWIEPIGSDDYDCWLPAQNVVRVNGRDVATTVGQPASPHPFFSTRTG
jgi:hypothetical protein